MKFDKWTKGKKLKPFICLVKILHGNPHRYDEDKTLKRLHNSFPYYEPEDLLSMVREFVAHLRASGSAGAELRKWHSYFYFYKYRDEIEKVSSPILYHFLRKEYLLEALKNEFFYPSILSLDEYISRPPSWIPALLRRPEIESTKWYESWQESVKAIGKYRQDKAKIARFRTYLSTRSFLPAINCFTELPSELVELHADHYGSYGLAFRKSEIIARGYHFDFDHDLDPTNMRFIRPIYYYDNDVSSLPWLIFEKISNPSLPEDERKRLMIDLALLKPISKNLLNPIQLYSVIHEREWRYVSFDSIFLFKRKMITRVLVSKVDYENWLNGETDETLAKIIEHCEASKLLLTLV